MGHVSHGRWAIAMSLLLAYGCQAPVQLHQLKQPWLALDHTGEHALVSPTGRAELGQLTVRFDAGAALKGADRRVLAAVADVETIVVTVKPANGVEVSQTVLKAAIAGGQAAASFAGLPIGDVTITVKAYDAAGLNVGANSATATVVAGQVISVVLPLQLAPTYAAGPGTVVGQFVNPDWLLWDIQVDGQGNVWAGGLKSIDGWQDHEGVVVKLAPDGSLLKEVTLTERVTELDVDVQGHVWAVGDFDDDAGTSGAWLYELDSDAVLLNQRSISFASDAADVVSDGQGNTWVANPVGRISRVAPDGTVSAVAGSGVTLMRGDGGDVWVTNLHNGTPGQDPADKEYVVRYSPAGVELGRYWVGAGYHSRASARDAAGNVWVVANPHDPATADVRLLKFSPTGADLGTFDVVGADVAWDVVGSEDGDVWVVTGEPHQAGVRRFSPQGVARGAMALPTATEPTTLHLAAGPSGVWVLMDYARTVIRIQP